MLRRLVPVPSAPLPASQVTAAMASAGVVLACRSRRRNDRFRVLVFDGRGDVRHQGEAQAVPEDKASGSRSRTDVVSRVRLFLAPCVETHV